MQEEEVEFNPRYETEVSRYNRFQNEEVEREESTFAELDVSQLSTTRSSGVNNSRRIDVLETEVGRVKTKVDSIDAELDLLIAAATPATAASTPKPGPHPRGCYRRRGSGQTQSMVRPILCQISLLSPNSPSHTCS